MKAIVSEKGQVTIPKPVRDRLGLRPGQVLEFEARNGLLIARKSAGGRRLVDSVFGILGSGVDVDAEINRMRGKPWNPKDDAPRAHRR
jgi:AbrB family looped-hinge helix DNA binding protein